MRKEEKMPVPLSIITVNYNNCRGLSKTVDSVLEQTVFGAFEYIIIDGGSTDGGIEVLCRNTDKITYWVSEKDSGIYNAMNKGIRQASGEYLMFLNSGDHLIAADIVEVILNYLKAYPGVDIFYGDAFIGSSTDVMQGLLKHPPVLELKYFKTETINHQASLIKAELFQQYGFYPEHYQLAADYWLFLRCFLDEKVFKHIDRLLVDYDFTGLSAVDGYKKYKNEQFAIWDQLVPGYVRSIVNENEALSVQDRHYRKILDYKIVSVAVRLNARYQGLKGAS
ncbi:glycosyltransferase [Hymenobacter sp. NBH84]|uniref:glycosyltransferase family 2 protein n=1 Tax=Hymenobacter sp. NBH84 TaxID=2596915 RepID=UPI0016269DD5|nr:glycosyltransferase family 2 protein [Hymenobacter sp. NBH84]QNE38417.1 glycosyltransferase [Hymenobacter sp. NBH84]